eukprot:CAMPEP_0182560642 /NCGR_PEP_ID=MMETSP1324-20130603/3237_1 /TAXON_ID=236786 /ORGANISM="Florenciella sp., Strain RCC1587" /LENGTH=32 /DNA_ID= /DNA_START= /DNA_END= /DNA_ORIENTATION=
MAERSRQGVAVVAAYVTYPNAQTNAFLTLAWA